MTGNADASTTRRPLDPLDAEPAVEHRPDGRRAARVVPKRVGPDIAPDLLLLPATNIPPLPGFVSSKVDPSSGMTASMARRANDTPSNDARRSSSRAAAPPSKVLKATAGAPCRPCWACSPAG